MRSRHGCGGADRADRNAIRMRCSSSNRKPHSIASVSPTPSPALTTASTNSVSSLVSASDPALFLMSTSMDLLPRSASWTTVAKLTVILHAVGRRFERSDQGDVNDAAILRDLAVLVPALPVIQPSRGKAVVTSLFGASQPKVWVSDMLGSQRGHAGLWQVCLAHLLRDAKYAIECGDTAFSAPFRWLLLRAIAIGQRRETLKDTTLRQYLYDLNRRLDRIMATVPAGDAGRKLHKRMLANRAHLFVFMTNRAVPYTNNISERHLRPSVVFRKVTNGFRCEWGGNLCRLPLRRQHRKGQPCFGARYRPLRADNQTTRRRPRRGGVSNYVAAVWVVFFHGYVYIASLLGGPDRSQVPIIRDGYLGVDLFFVLSGFVLSLAYSEHFQRNFKSAIIGFFFARFWRIFPLHWACLAIFVLLVWAFPENYWGPGPFTLSALAASAALVQNWIPSTALAWNDPTWSLSAELAAYLVFPLLTFAISRLRDRRPAFCLALVSLLTLALSLTVRKSQSLNHAGPPGIVRCLFEFSAGALAWKSIPADAWKPASTEDGSYRRLGEMCMGLGGAVLLLALALPEILVIAPVAFMMFILGCALSSRTAGWLFGNTVVVFLGNISFSIYLVHLFVLGCLTVVISSTK